MYDYKQTLKAQLDTILPTYYELFVDSKTATPCITYIQTNDIARQEADGLRYSTQIYQIKVWGNDISALATYAGQVDTIMYGIKAKRTSYNEVAYEGDQMFIVMTYEVIAREKPTPPTPNTQGVNN